MQLFGMHAANHVIVMKSSKAAVGAGGWQVKGRFDWFFMILSLILFLGLEAGLLYSYFTLINNYRH
jgi:hypothetical protein